MAPIRRYLRITKYSVLECRIYLDNPALVDSWFLNARNPILPRVIESVRPLILPKLQEEKERSKAKGKKTSKGIKDVVVEDDFEVAIFLTEPSTRHSLLTRQRHFQEPRGRLDTGTRKLIDLANDQPQDFEAQTDSPIILREDDEDDLILQDTPLVFATEVNDSTISNDKQDTSRRRRSASRASDPVGEDEDKKKLLMSSSYDGFSIYGRVLCLIVKRRQGIKLATSVTSGQVMMENWITATQQEPEDD